MFSKVDSPGPSWAMPTTIAVALMSALVSFHRLWMLIDIGHIKKTNPELVGRYSLLSTSHMNDMKEKKLEIGYAAA